VTADINASFDLPDVDWDQSVQWNDGTPAIVEKGGYGYMLAWLDKDQLPAGLPDRSHMHFQDSVALYNDGTIVGLDSEARVENTEQPMDGRALWGLM